MLRRCWLGRLEATGRDSNDDDSSWDISSLDSTTHSTSFAFITTVPSPLLLPLLLLLLALLPPRHCLWSSATARLSVSRVEEGIRVDGWLSKLLVATLSVVDTGACSVVAVDGLLLLSGTGTEIRAAVDGNDDDGNDDDAADDDDGGDDSAEYA